MWISLLTARAFTLVEMLTVVAVVAVLAALAVPVMQRAMVAARQQGCASNMRQIGAAICLYAADNDGWMPGTTHTETLRNSWIETLRPYLANCDKVRISPGDPKGAQRLKAGGSSYILNSFVFVPRIGPFGETLPGTLNRLSRIPRPTETLLAANISDQQGASAQNDHTHSDLWGGNWTRLCADIQPDRFTTAPKPDHSRGSANYLFADGHVSELQAADVKARLERGDNIAQPPL